MLVAAVALFGGVYLYSNWAASRSNTTALTAPANVPATDSDIDMAAGRDVRTAPPCFDRIASVRLSDNGPTIEGIARSNSLMSERVARIGAACIGKWRMWSDPFKERLIVVRAYLSAAFAANVYDARRAHNLLRAARQFYEKAKPYARTKAQKEALRSARIWADAMT